MKDVNLLPDVDKELEEIKKLLIGESDGSSPHAHKPDSAHAGPVGPDAQKTSGTQQNDTILPPAPPRSPGTPVSGVDGSVGTPLSGVDEPITTQTPGTHQARQAQGVPNVIQLPGASQAKQASDIPSVVQTPGTPPAKQASVPPAVRQAPGTPQVRRAPDVPAVRQHPEMPEIIQEQDVGPAISRRRRRPLLPEPPAPPGTDDSGKVRSYDISSDGKITKSSDSELDTGSEDFKIKFDFESAYKDVPEERPLRFRREKRTGCIGGLLYGAFIICVSIVLATILWMATVDVMGFGSEDELVNVIVPSDFAIEDITDMLYDAGLIKYKFLFNIYAGFSKAEEKIRAGSYMLNKNFDYRAIVQGMTARSAARVETTVTIPEGLTLAQMFTVLEDYGVCSANDLWEAATNHDFKYSFLDKETLGDRLRLEGFLFPDTYNFYLNSTPVQVISKLLQEFDRRFTDDYETRAENMGYTVREIIIVASMVEREAGSEEERPRIAAVIYNRLNSKDFPNLQIDATIRYAIAGTAVPFSTDIDSPFNTYIHEGLPPGPIASPSMASIRAALYPESTNEYYYALNKEGTHNFFRTYAQHDAFVKSADYGG